LLQTSSSSETDLQTPYETYPFDSLERGYVLSQQLSKPSIVPELRESFPKTALAFDWLKYVIQRIEELVWASKYLIFGTAFLLFLIYELAHFAMFLLKNWSG
jgi:hypothetical protein